MEQNIEMGFEGSVWPKLSASFYLISPCLGQILSIKCTSENKDATLDVVIGIERQFIQDVPLEFFSETQHVIRLTAGGDVFGPGKQIGLTIKNERDVKQDVRLEFLVRLLNAETTKQMIDFLGNLGSDHEGYFYHIPEKIKSPHCNGCGRLLYLCICYPNPPPQ